MVNTLQKPKLKELHPNIQSTAKETLLTPRFYTTDFEALAKMDISINEEELKAILEEFRTDYNRYHFIRRGEFSQTWDHFDEDTRKLFVEFLERSCTAEFSGFLLYKELGRRLKNKNPILAECFLLMSRDEARHAGFLNKALSDFNMTLDLGFLTKSRSYTFFQPKFIFYATYLSEKIGYWRYITIYRHLENNPENKIYPIFNFFENWCQDENRHGDFFDAIMKANPEILNDWKARLWCRFFLLSVFATMYFNDTQRSDVYSAIGLNARDYDKHVIEKTNEVAGRVFPVILNLKDPKFYERLEICVSNNAKLREIDSSEQHYTLKFLRKLPILVSNASQLLKLYLINPINTEHLQGNIR